MTSCELVWLKKEDLMLLLKENGSCKAIETQKDQTHQKLFSRVMAKQYLRDVKPNTLSQVEGQGCFKNQIDSGLIERVLPKFCD